MRKVIKKKKKNIYLFIFVFVLIGAHPFNGDEWDVGVARDGPVPCVTAAVRIVKIYAAGIALGPALDPTVIVDEVAEFAHGGRVVAIVIDCRDCRSLRRPRRDVFVLPVEHSRVGIHLVQ